ncbi:MAG: tRNA (adenosine(37)-N6)-threonylcarbamoyltransferase complex ATPase subunit type 1 TsaE [Patescibacteria group bacterium]|jgi:tRNA threonylcarbamoyladenosine biosynthesis protein TsaE
MTSKVAKKIISQSEQATWQEGFLLAQKLVSGETLALQGNLGAGKTKFLQGLASGLGVVDIVNSPTFNILKLYPVVNNAQVDHFCHIDAYRLNSEEDLISLGVEEFLADPKTIVAVEWAEKIDNLWPKNTLDISLKVLTENDREIIIKKRPPSN